MYLLAEQNYGIAQKLSTTLDSRQDLSIATYAICSGAIMISLKHPAFRRAVIGAVAVTVGAAMASSASAKYTAIDMADEDTNLYYYFGGYCQTSGPSAGDECGSTYTLPYSVTFGTGETTNQLSVRSDGKVQFVGAALANPGSDVDLFEVLATIDTGISGEFNFFPQVASLLPNPYYLDKELSDFFPGLIDPDADYTLTNPQTRITWFSCGNPKNDCYTELHTLTLTPTREGLYVRYGGINDKPDELITASFDPAATVSVPEPGAWALMLMGFGALGAALRADRRRVGATTTAS
jgi:hypothetical protein